jgi:hypothetical protein
VEKPPAPAEEEKTRGFLYWTLAPGEAMETAPVVALAAPERASWTAAPVPGKKSREKEEVAAAADDVISRGRRRRRSGVILSITV